MRLRKPGGFLVIISFFVVSATTQSDPCLDGVNEDASRLKLPHQYANLTPPWQRADGQLAKVTRSEGLIYHWSWMKALPVNGLSKSVEDVVVFLNKNRCFFVPVGSLVRSVLLGIKSVYISGEVSCELHELYTKCVKQFGAHGCSLYPIEDGGWGAYRLEIGDASSNRSTFSVKAEPIVLYEWRSIIGAPKEQWRFTVDTLALFDNGAGDLVVIDPTGLGFKHVCDKKLAPASDSWDDWSRNQPMKVLGFYDLRADGFAHHNDEFHKFVNKKIKEATDKRTAQQFYCEHVLKGVSNLEGSTPVCHTTYPEKVGAKKIGQMRTVMINELGVTWNSTIGKAANELEAVFCTARQFVDIRARLLHKVTSAEDELHSHSGLEPPKIIEEGLPMVNDGAQVHTRPILDMSENVPELPPEYPNAPRAEPNERLEFVEPSVEGAGSEPIASFSHGYSREHPTEDMDAELHVLGVPVEENNDFSDHNSINRDIPVMRFDKVEENELADVAPSTLEVSMTSRSFNSIMPILSIMLLFAFYL